MANDTTTTLIIHARGFDALTPVPLPIDAGEGYQERGAIHTWKGLATVGIVTAELLRELGIKTPALLKTFADKEGGVFTAVDRVEVVSELDNVREWHAMRRYAQEPLEIGPTDMIRFAAQGGGNRNIRFTLNPLTGLESVIWNQRCCGIAGGGLPIMQNVSEPGTELEAFESGEVMMVGANMAQDGKLVLPPLDKTRAGQRVCVVQLGPGKVTVAPAGGDPLNGGATAVKTNSPNRGVEFLATGTPIGWFAVENAN